MKAKKFLAILMAGVIAASAMMVTASAATETVSWRIYFVPGAPSSVSNTVDTCTVGYYAEGYRATCTSISGPYDRHLTITATTNGGLRNINGVTNGTVLITTTETTPVFKTVQSSTTKVTFKVQLYSLITGNRASNGTIYTVD